LDPLSGGPKNFCFIVLAFIKLITIKNPVGPFWGKGKLSPIAHAWVAVAVLRIDAGFFSGAPIGIRIHQRLPHVGPDRYLAVQVPNIKNLQLVIDIRHNLPFPQSFRIQKAHNFGSIGVRRIPELRDPKDPTPILSTGANCLFIPIPITHVALLALLVIAP
jgi:hypothetical protein